MKLVRFGPPGRERPGIWLEEENAILDVNAMAFNIADYDGFFFERLGTPVLRALLNEKTTRKTIPADSVRLGPPVARPSQLICLGKNYIAHVAEVDARPAPGQPIYFSKSTGAINGPHDVIQIPPGVTRVDAECELAVVLGRTVRNIAEADALTAVAGYTILNDVTDREAQKADDQWFRAKSHDTFGPMGPFLVTADAFGDPHNKMLRQKVNGLILQNGHTRDMIFKIPFLISYLSRTMTLRAGDIIATGTPGGIGSARIPPIFLKSGDMVECAVEDLGATRNRVQ